MIPVDVTCWNQVLNLQISGGFYVMVLMNRTLSQCLNMSIKSLKIYVVEVSL